jgi:hypothetical protein
VLFARQTNAPPSHLNGYDWLKLLALALMTLDHVGAYLFPDAQWMRAIGRASFPLWLFLAGYGGRLSVPASLWMGALLVCGLQAAWLDMWLPLNILFSIIVARYALWLLTRRTQQIAEPLTCLVGCVLFMPISMLLIDYGTLAILFALLGYAHAKQDNRASIVLVFSVTWVAYLGWQYLLFDFNTAHTLLMLAACAPIIWLMWHFNPHAATLPIHTRAHRVARWLSRQSLVYYVLHLALLIPLGVFIKTL